MCNLMNIVFNQGFLRHITIEVISMLQATLLI